MRYRARVIIQSLTAPNSAPVTVDECDVEMAYTYEDGLPGSRLILLRATLDAEPYLPARSSSCPTCGAADPRMRHGRALKLSDHPIDTLCDDPWHDYTGSAT